MNLNVTFSETRKEDKVILFRKVKSKVIRDKAMEQPQIQETCIEEAENNTTRNKTIANDKLISKGRKSFTH